MALASSVIDDFNNGVIGAQWNYLTPELPPAWGGYTVGGTVAEAAGVLGFEPASNQACGVQTADEALEFDEIFFKLPEFELLQNSDFVCSIHNMAGGGGDRGGQNMRFEYARNFGDPQIRFIYSNFGSGGTNYEANFDPDEHQWILITNTGTTIICAIAPPGPSDDVPGTYVDVRDVVATGGDYWAPDEVDIFIGALNWNSVSGIRYAIDNFNYTNAGGGFNSALASQANQVIGAL
jgi:hypothetical protein